MTVEFWSSRYLRIAGGLLLVVGVVGTILYLFSSPIVSIVNTATRADLSQHVSDKPCGLNIGTCPGQLKCYHGRYQPGNAGFVEERVGANISGARCVTPTYEEHACGLFAWTIHKDSWPAHRGTCISYAESPQHGLSDYIGRLLDVDDLYDRVFNTDQNGTERIRSHGLKLAKEALQGLAEITLTQDELNTSIRQVYPDAFSGMGVVEWYSTDLEEYKNTSLPAVTAIQSRRKALNLIRSRIVDAFGEEATHTIIETTAAEEYEYKIIVWHSTNSTAGQQITTHELRSVVPDKIKVTVIYDNHTETVLLPVHVTDTWEQGAAGNQSSH